MAKAQQSVVDEGFPGWIGVVVGRVDAVEGLLEITRVRNDRLDYARTCREWAHRLAAHGEAARGIAGSARVANYERFLKMSAAAFERGGLVLLRLTLRKLDG